MVINQYMGLQFFLEYYISLFYNHVSIAIDDKGTRTKYTMFGVKYAFYTMSFPDDQARSSCSVTYILPSQNCENDIDK